MGLEKKREKYGGRGVGEFAGGPATKETERAGTLSRGFSELRTTGPH